MNFEELTGQATSHILQLEEPRFAAAPQTVRAFLAMREAARLEGLELSVFSGFRDFNSQLRIWNMKAEGRRPLLDLSGEPLDYGSLTSEEIIEGILRWSALPGASRHHWGSELDLIDLNAMPPGYRVQLVLSEYSSEGVFGPLNQWLEARAEEFGFFRPYRIDRGGVAPEPWHLSLREISQPRLDQLELAALTKLLAGTNLGLRDEVLVKLPNIFEQYILNICP